MIIKSSSLPFFGLITALAFFSCLMLAGPGADRAEAEDSGYPAQIFIDAAPALNHAGTASGTTVTYITSNGVPRTVFIADGLEKSSTNLWLFISTPCSTTSMGKALSIDFQA